MRALISIIIMLTITPIAAVVGLVSFDPSNWGGTPTVQSILAMSLVGLITVPVWITYIPSLVLTPIIMNKFSRQETFHSVPIWKFFGISFLGGIVAGLFILLPCIFLASGESLKLTLNWAFSGIVAGSVTFPIIAFLYRFPKPKA